MNSIFKNTRYKLIRNANLVAGFWLPRAENEKSPTIHLLEALHLGNILLTMWSMIPFLEDVARRISVRAVGPSVFTMLLYVTALTRYTHAIVARKKFCSLFAQVNSINNCKPFESDQKENLDSTCKKVRNMLFAQLSLFVLANSAISYFGYKITTNREGSSAFNQMELELLGRAGQPELWTPRETLSIFLNMILSYMVPLKLITLDALLHLLYVFICDQVDFLEDQFDLITKTESATEAQATLQEWLSLFSKVKRLMIDVNDAFSFQTVSLLLSNMAIICFAAYTSAKIFSLFFFVTMIVLTLFSVLQTLLYCISGQNLLNTADKLCSRLANISLADQPLVSVHHILLVETQRSFAVRGGPFFKLSLEFFATIIGAVFTYFMVLIQI
ncbi:Hypothetical predicted protein [Cloeon dipterum]|uniref:Odorant receptor n=1 Tax=Cloeon dipterum TaxID=197152 RepID=A0A8S1CV10_9INSE|nr:Hypothetical predicted protein [Cloeon dipterum]